MLASSLFLLGLTNQCSAQEPTSKTGLEFTIIIASSESNTIDGNITDSVTDGSTTSAIPESPTADPEFPPDSTFFLPQSQFPKAPHFLNHPLRTRVSNNSSPSLLLPSIVRDSKNAIRQLSAGEIGDISIKGEEICLGISYKNSKTWRLQLSSEDPPGNVTQIRIHENAGFGLVATIRVPWQDGSLEECPPYWIASGTKHPSAAMRFTTTTRRGFDESVTANSPNVDGHKENMLSTQLLDSPSPSLFIAVPQTRPDVPTPTPTSTSRQIALWPQSASSMGNTVQPSVPATEATPQVQGGDSVKAGGGFKTRIVSVGASTALTVVPEIPLGTYLIRSNPEAPVVLATQPFIGILSLTTIVAIVGSLLVWLKKRKKVRGFKELEDATSNKSSAETNGITLFVTPGPELHNPVNPDSKRRLTQGVPRTISPVMRIGNSGTHSGLFTMPITESLNEDLSPGESSSDPFKRLFRSPRDRKEAQPKGSGS
ncbi:hypothetical protein CPB86DRAFT_878636 [Serendipita vermifera]|nr:hypothetical protein CPB86DRAFT_878636 [Serendipita vermifera]